MASDHFVARAYQRGFTKEFFRGSAAKGGHLFISPTSGVRGRPYPINVIGCEDEFYAGHQIDRMWQDAEQGWPHLSRRLGSRTTSHEDFLKLVLFASIQFHRVPENMEVISRQLSRKNATFTDIPGRPGKRAMFFDTPSTTEILDILVTRIPAFAAAQIDTDDITCIHNSHAVPFITSDVPAVTVEENRVFVVNARIAMIGVAPRGSHSRRTLRHRAATLGEVEAIREAIVRGASQYVLAPDYDPEIATLIASRPRKPIEATGRTFQAEPEPWTEERMKRMMKMVDKIREKRPKE